MRQNFLDMQYVGVLLLKRIGFTSTGWIFFIYRISNSVSGQPDIQGRISGRKFGQIFVFRYLSGNQISVSVRISLTGYPAEEMGPFDQCGSVYYRTIKCLKVWIHFTCWEWMLEQQNIDLDIFMFPDTILSLYSWFKYGFKLISKALIKCGFGNAPW